MFLLLLSIDVRVHVRIRDFCLDVPLCVSPGSVLCDCTSSWCLPLWVCDDAQWVGCDNRTCRRWVHVECEINGGNSVDSTAYYLCPSCREVLFLGSALLFWPIHSVHLLIVNARVFFWMRYIITQSSSNELRLFIRTWSSE